MADHQKSVDWTQNNLLNRLQPQDVDLIVPHLKTHRAPPNVVLYKEGQNVDTVYFPCGATLVSFLIDVEEGTAIETTLIGREGAVGGIVSHGQLPAYSRIMVQFGGDFVTLALPLLEAAKLKSRTLDSLFARYADCMVAQIFQATACNAAHTIEQRACKWIDAALERTGTLEVPLTQERLSAMLGVGRSYISRVIGELKREDIVRVKRGKIIVSNRDALSRKACKCNQSVKEHFETVLTGVYPTDNEA